MNEHPTTPFQRAKMVFDAIKNPTIRPSESERIIFCNDGSTLCVKCVTDDKWIRHQVIHGLKTDHVQFIGTHEEGPPLTCIYCSREIEAEFGDPWSEETVG